MSAPLISLGTIIDQSWHRYREQFRKLMGISLWMLAGYPFYIASLVVFFAAPESPTAILTAVLLSLIGSLTFFVSLIISFGALVMGANAAEEGKAFTPKAMLRASVKKLPRQLLLWIAIGLVVLASIIFPVPGYLITMTASLPDVVQGIGILLFFLGGIASIAYCLYFGVTLTFAPYAMLLEDCKVGGSLTRTFTLTSSRWWSVAMRVILPKLIIIVIALIAQQILLTLINVIEAALLSPEAIAEAGLTLALAVMVKQIAATLIAALAAPMYVLADSYVFRSLAETGTKKSS